MLLIPNMIMIGGNSLNARKRIMACEIISKLSGLHQIIGLKFTFVKQDKMKCMVIMRGKIHPAFQFLKN